MFEMFDNFVEQKYHSYDEVFVDPTSSNCIYIGDIESALNLDFLKSKKITTVVTAARDMDHVQYDGSILHIVYPLLDGKQEDITSFFDNFYNIVQNNLSKGSILVHCAAGISRSSTLVISYLMRLQRIGFKEAIAQVRKHRPSVLPNLGFERQLKRYEDTTKPTDKPQRKCQSKTTESSGHQLLMKTQLVVPNFGLLGKSKPKTSHAPNIIDKLSDKEGKVLRIYNNHQDRNSSKHKKFVITKKASSFSRQPEPKQHKPLMIGNFREANLREQSHKRTQKQLSSIQEMRAIYLHRKGLPQRQNTTERSGTFYNVRTNRADL